MHDQAMALFLFQPSSVYGMSKKVVKFKPRTDEVPLFAHVELRG